MENIEPPHNKAIRSKLLLLFLLLICIAPVTIATNATTTTPIIIAPKAITTTTTTTTTPTQTQANKETSKFDILLFYGPQIAGTVTTDPLFYFSLIDNYMCSGNNDTDKAQCSCRPSCIYRGACCIDYFWNDRQSWSSMDDYVSYFLSKQLEELSCQPIVRIDKNDGARRNDGKTNGTESNNNGYDRGIDKESTYSISTNSSITNSNTSSTTVHIDHVYMMTGCVKWNRLRLSTDFHPMVDTSNGVVYMNPTIAECHGAQQFSPVSLEVGCEEAPVVMQQNREKENNEDASSVLLTEIQSKSKCRYQASKKIDNLISFCNPANKCHFMKSESANNEKSNIAKLTENRQELQYGRNAELCEKYSGPITINGKGYRNFHCSKCDEERGHLFEPYNVEIPKPDIGPRGFPMPHSVTLNYGRQGASVSYIDGYKGDFPY